MYVELFEDYENNRISLGMYKKIRKIKADLPFFPEYINDTVKNNEKDPAVYYLEK